MNTTLLFVTLCLVALCFATLQAEALNKNLNAIARAGERAQIQATLSSQIETLIKPGGKSAEPTVGVEIETVEFRVVSLYSVPNDWNNPGAGVSLLAVYPLSDDGVHNGASTIAYTKLAADLGPYGGVPLLSATWDMNDDIAIRGRQSVPVATLEMVSGPSVATPAQQEGVATALKLFYESILAAAKINTAAWQAPDGTVVANRGDV